ncbi:S-layer homology domain-containing protein [Propionibacterium freudenreichii]|uniref:S-layer homology domain-containing protein n=1 Tax=Propionibacterium freudenreichii TaxID=1744 RepID=UPI00254FC713|nr:S-layer homology domain-containing protein [Propionibacterium freudenreichii]MDK9331292.1 S-layer homology domain-containing protein [Propionibacterium freudenreichii]
MSVRKSLTGMALGLALTITPLAGAVPASADTAPAPKDAITKAADWLVNDYNTNCLGDKQTSYSCSNGGLADVILALSSTGDAKYADEISTMMANLAPQVAGYTKDNAGATAKIIITAIAAHQKPSAFGGNDLVGQLQALNAENPAGGGAWGPQLSVVALTRAGETVPEAVVDATIAKQNSKGGFGWGGDTGDGDNTAIGMMATAAVAKGNPKAADSLAKAVGWAQDPANLTTDDTGSYWTNYSPTNTAGMMLMAIGDVNDPKIDVSKQMDFLIGRQLPSGAFSNTLKGTNDNAMATTQALQGLTMHGYLTASAGQKTDPVTQAFTDVAPSNMYFTEIQWAAANNVTTGWKNADGTASFRPLDTTHRDAMAAFLYRLSGSPSYTAPATSPFTDVNPSNQFYKEICWLASQNITTGWPDGSFRPLDNVNRDAMAAFLYRYSQVSGFQAPAASPFADVTPGSQFYTEMSWLSANGISTGWPDQTFRPVTPIARDAMITFIYRMKHAS